MALSYNDLPHALEAREVKLTHPVRTPLGTWPVGQFDEERPTPIWTKKERSCPMPKHSEGVGRRSPANSSGA